MSQDSSLLTLLKTYLKDYENIDENIYTVIANYLNTGKDSNTQEKMNIDTLPRTAPAEGEPDNRIWRNSLSSLLTELHNNFEVMRTETEEHKQEYLNYANNMKIILNKSRIDVEDLNDNFKLITTGLNRIFAELFSARTETHNKYQSMFNSIMKEIIPLWENVMYLWLAFLLKERDNIQVPVVKFVYTDKTLLDDIVDELMPYIDEYPDSHLCLIPIIKMNNYYLNYYAQQGYPGIFYHAPNFNSKVFKCERKFLFYQFVPFNRTELSYELARAGCIKDGRSDNLYLGHKVYGHKIVTNDLYFTAPLDEIHLIKEIYPKTYYSQIRVKPSFEMYARNGALEIKTLTFNYYDVFNSEKLIGTYDASNITLELSKGLEELKTATKYSLAAQIIFRQEITDEEISCPLTKKTNFRNTNIKLTGFDEECICGPATSAEEDYEYLIEYVPLAARSGAAIEDAEPLITTEDLNYIKANYVGSSSESNSLYNKDNDLLDQHYDWDREQNNIVEDKFVLRIGQHWEGDAYIYDNLSSNKKALIPDECKHNATRSYFDYSYGTQDITEKQSNIEYYNKGTVEVGAYLNIPFIKNRHKKLFYYPDFLSHTYGSDYLAPLTSIEWMNTNLLPKPEYFSYNKLFKDMPISKDTYFEIYTEKGNENFEGNWCIKMIEVIKQDTPTEESFFGEIEPPPNKVATMREMYEWYQENKNDLNKDILAFFSQLNPDSDISESSTDNINKRKFKNYVKNKYKNIVMEFFPKAENAIDEEYDDMIEAILQEIAEGLVMDQIHADKLKSYVTTEAPYTEGYTKINYARTINDYNNDFIEAKTVFPGHYISATGGHTVEYRNSWREEFPAMAELYFYTKDGIDNISTIGSNNEKLTDSVWGDASTDIPAQYVRTAYVTTSAKQHFLGSFNKTTHIDYKDEPLEDTDLSLYKYNYWTPKMQPDITENISEESYSFLDNDINCPLFYCGFAASTRECYSNNTPNSGNSEVDDAVAAYVHFSPFSFIIFGMNVPFYNYNGQRHVIKQLDNATTATTDRYNYSNKYNSASLYYYPKGAEDRLWGDTSYNYDPINLSSYMTAKVWVDADNDSDNRLLTSTKKKIKDVFTPFFDIITFSEDSSSFGSSLASIKSRQYPHIYLSNNKTLLPQSIFVSKKQKKINFEIFKNDNHYNILRNYYSKINSIPNSNQMPYPLPTETYNTTYTKEEIKNNFLKPIKDTYISMPNDYRPPFAGNNFGQTAHMYYTSYDNRISFMSGDKLINNIFDETFFSNYTYYVDDISNIAADIIGQGNYNDPNVEIKLATPKTFNMQIKIIDAEDNVTVLDNSQTITKYRNNSDITVNNPLKYQDSAAMVGQMNLQIVVHYFGPKKNGVPQYARKILTRQLTTDGQIQDNHFVVDGEKELNYHIWTNTWQQSYFNQQQFEDFESNLSNLSVFKQSPSLIYDDSGTTRILDFEDNPNAGTYLTPQQKQDQELHII